MKRVSLIFSVIVAFVLTTTVTAQMQEIAKETWTNGNYEYEVQLKGNALIFIGHEWFQEGPGFQINKQANGEMVLSKIKDDPASLFYCPEQYLGSKVEYTVLNGQKLLIIKDKKGALADIFVNNNLKDLLTSSAVRYLAGTYVDSKGKTYVFNANASRASGFGSTEDFTVDALYALPEFVISFGNNTHYMLTGNTQKDANGIKLRFYIGKKEEYDQWSWQNALSMELTKTKWNSNITDKNIAGRYPFTATNVMTTGELKIYTHNELDIMRNEIYARHGHIFKTARYRDYFNAQPWYKGTVNEAGNLLSEIEQLNVAQIKAAQEIIKNAN